MQSKRNLRHTCSRGQVGNPPTSQFSYCFTPLIHSKDVIPKFLVIPFSTDKCFESIWKSVAITTFARRNWAPNIWPRSSWSAAIPCGIFVGLFPAVRNITGKLRFWEDSPAKRLASNHSQNKSQFLARQCTERCMHPKSLWPETVYQWNFF